MKIPSRFEWSEMPSEEIGKTVERLFCTTLDSFSHSVGLIYHRLPDSRAARGGIKAQPADYIYRCGSKAGFIEVKGVGHESVLKKGSIRQLPILRLWGSKGDDGLVIVYHYTLGLWRIVSPMKLDPAKSSWNLNEFSDTHSNLYEAFVNAGVFRSRNA